MKLSVNGDGEGERKKLTFAFPIYANGNRKLGDTCYDDEMC